MAERLHVVGLSGSRTTPSARFRVGQFVGPLAAHGVDLEWRPSALSEYPPRAKWLRPFWLPATLAARLPDLARSRGADVTLLNREFVSTLATVEGWSGRPRVFDVDDAIFLRRGGGYAARLAASADRVIAGNTFLAEWFGRHNPAVEILPTAVDTGRFRPSDKPADGPARIGWSGTSSNHGSLLALEPVLARVLAERPQARVTVCSDRAPAWRDLPADRVDFMPWSPAAEVPFLQGLAVGLMPLPDTDWTRGKCAYKMLLYLSCGVPAVVSPVGMNVEVLAGGNVGRAADGDDAWTGALLDLLDDPDGRAAMGRDGRRLVAERYGVDVVAARLAAILRRTAAGN